MAFFVAATTTNKIDNYTTPWDVTNVARPLIRGTAEGGMTVRCRDPVCWHDGSMLNSRDAEFVPLLTLTEGARAEAPIRDAEAEDLVLYCLERGREWWAEHALNWVEEGVRGPSILPALAGASRDPRLGQALRHRALRLHRGVAAEPPA